MPGDTREFTAFGEKFPYKRIGISRVGDRELGRVIYGYQTAEQRATHLEAEKKAMTEGITKR